MKKLVLSLLFLVLIISAPAFANAALVNCGNNPTYVKNADGTVTCNGCCTIRDFFQVLVNIYRLIVVQIATPLAIIALIIGAIFMMVSAGNPSTFHKGQEILKWAIIGLVLAFTSYIIIDFILKAIGFVGNWSKPF